MSARALLSRAALAALDAGGVMPGVAGLGRGDRIVVRFGGRGVQLAEVLGPWQDNRGVPLDARRYPLTARLPVRKWRANSKRWTSRTFVRVPDVAMLGWDGLGVVSGELSRAARDAGERR